MLICPMIAPLCATPPHHMSHFVWPPAPRSVTPTQSSSPHPCPYHPAPNLVPLRIIRVGEIVFVQIFLQSEMTHTAHLKMSGILFHSLVVRGCHPSSGGCRVSQALKQQRGGRSDGKTCCEETATVVRLTSLHKCGMGEGGHAAPVS